MNDEKEQVQIPQLPKAEVPKIPDPASVQQDTAQDNSQRNFILTFVFAIASFVVMLFEAVFFGGPIALFIASLLAGASLFFALNVQEGTRNSMICISLSIVMLVLGVYQFASSVGDFLFSPARYEAEYNAPRQYYDYYDNYFGGYGSDDSYFEDYFSSYYD